MSYDFPEGADRSPPIVTSFVPQPHDLETIVLLLQLAAIELTTAPGAEFTFEQMLQTACSYGGDDLVVDERDVRIVIPHATFLKRRGRLFSLK
jgi:hypothetical protein